jgi:hypothetical protein
MTGIDDKSMAVNDKIVMIGHPFQLDHPTNANGSTYKVVEVGRVHAVETNNIRYAHLDTRGGSSGAGLLDADTGYLIGVHRAGSDDGASCGGSAEIQGVANPIDRIFRSSSIIHGDRGTGHFLKNYGWGDDDPYLTQLTTVSGWGSRWHHIVPGRFNSGALDDLFFYDSTAGTGRFYFVNSSRNARDGFGAFYGTDGAGSLSEIRHDSSWGRNWNQLVAGDLIPATAGSELVFHSRRLAWFHIYRTNSNGTIAKIAENNGSTIAPTVLVAGDFNPDPDGRLELFAYEGASRTAHILSFSNSGVMSVVRSASLGTYYSQIGAGDFMTATGTELLAYDPATGSVVVYQPYNGTFTPVSTQTGLRQNFGKLVTANFMGSDGYESLFYDRFRTADQSCSTGIANDNTCCAASCGSCGGSGCSTRPGGSEACCVGTIEAAGVSCTESGPPCVMNDPQCITGIPGSDVCCDAACGTCGGGGCGSLPGGSTNCCIGSIRNSGRSCAEYPPPCVMP